MLHIELYIIPIYNSMLNNPYWILFIKDSTVDEIDWNRGLIFLETSTFGFAQEWGIPEILVWNGNSNDF